MQGSAAHETAYPNDLHNTGLFASKCYTFQIQNMVKMLVWSTDNSFSSGK